MDTYRGNRNVGEARPLDGDNALVARAQQIIPGGTNTISKRVAAFGGVGNYPAYIERADGARVFDRAGNTYLDFVGALAPNVLGYNNAVVKAAVAAQLERGVLFSLPPPSEVELSELIVSLVPCAEMVRLLKTGAEATSAAIRVARLYTGRDIILSCGYQGWHDWWAVTRDKRGIPAHTDTLTRTFPFGDIDGARALIRDEGDKVACIIVTPALYGVSAPSGFLEGLRALADEAGAVLIFDEIITGFRWSIGGAQSVSGVTPDLATFAKAMANGMPIAALVGKRSLMEPTAENWISSTYASEALSIAAAIATITILRDTDAIPRLYQLARLFSANLLQIGYDLGISIAPFEPLPAMRFEFDQNLAGLDDLNRRFMRNCAELGVLLRRESSGFSMCFSAAVTDEEAGLATEVIRTSLLKALAKAG